MNNEILKELVNLFDMVTQNKDKNVSDNTYCDLSVSSVFEAADVPSGIANVVSSWFLRVSLKNNQNDKITWCLALNVIFLI